MLDFATQKAGLKPFGVSPFGLDKWSPADLPFAFKEWWRIEYGLPAVGSAVDAWIGSIRGLNLAQVVGARQPIFQADMLNGFPAVRFISGDVLVIADLGISLTQPTTIITVIKEPTDNNAVRVMFRSPVGLTPQFQQLGADNTYRLHAGIAINTSYSISTGFSIFSLTFNRASSVFRVNGTDYSPVSDIGDREMGIGFTVGAIADGTLSSDMSVTDILLIDGLFTAAQFAQSELFLNQLRGGVY